MAQRDSSKRAKSREGKKGSTLFSPFSPFSTFDTTEVEERRYFFGTLSGLSVMTPSTPLPSASVISARTSANVPVADAR